MDLDFFKQQKVLYVEDDEAIMETFSKILRKVFKEVVTATDGIKGVEAFKQNPDINYVISDIKMPNMDGLEMIAQIKKINKDIPCILTTAHGEYDYFMRADEVGVYRYIQKPVNINELFEAINDHKSGKKVQRVF